MRYIVGFVTILFLLGCGNPTPISKITSKLVNKKLVLICTSDTSAVIESVYKLDNRLAQQNVVYFVDKPNFKFFELKSSDIVYYDSQYLCLKNQHHYYHLLIE